LHVAVRSCLHNRVALALEEAAAAIAVDGTWPKGYYFKALALEELGEHSRALAACEEGLHIHRCVGSTIKQMGTAGVNVGVGYYTAT
jgi:hypothetical protein